MDSTAHLLHGFIGSGKTTFVRLLEAKRPAVRLTHDEWMRKLYDRAPPEDAYPEYYRRIDELIWDTAVGILASGSDVILDLGFWTRESRDAARERVAAIGSKVSFYSIECPRATMLTRTLARSENPPADSMWVDCPAFERLWLRFEPMGDDETYTRIDGTGTERR